MKYAFTVAALSAIASAATHQVQVGPGLSYSPDSLTASDGDVVQFTFGSGHDVVSGSLDSPCQPSGGVYSGMPNDGDVFSVTVNGTDPVWIYCSVPHHCQAGMAMVINPPSGKTIDDYKNAAQSVGSSSAPSNIGGGVFGNPSSGGSSASSSASAAASSATSAASAAASSGSAASSSAASSASAAVSSASAAASSAVSSASAAATSSGAAVPTSVPFGGAVMAAAGLMALL